MSMQIKERRATKGRKEGRSKEGGNKIK